jgi:Tryptophan-associated transmembrane protein (Trp_oprn_chp)
VADNNGPAGRGRGPASGRGGEAAGTGGAGPEGTATPEAGPESTPVSTTGPTGPERRSLRLALVAVLVGVMLAAIGAGQAWATVGAVVELPGIGAGRVGTAEVTGNDLMPLGALALLGLVLLVAVAATRGRGRWPVGLALLGLGGALVVGAAAGAWRVGEQARERALSGLLDGVPAGGLLRVDTPPAGPVLVAAGGLLLAAAGVEALRRGRRWPALGDAFRAPPDRAQPAAAPGEPPWEGD